MAKRQKCDARKKVDCSIRLLWAAFQELHHESPGELTETEADLWARVTAHRAVQERQQSHRGNDYDS